MSTGAALIPIVPSGVLPISSTGVAFTPTPVAGGLAGAVGAIATVPPSVGDGNVVNDTDLLDSPSGFVASPYFGLAGYNDACIANQNCLYTAGHLDYSYWSGFPLIVLFLAILQNAWMGWMVFRAREHCNIPHPNLVAVPGLRYTTGDHHNTHHATTAAGTTATGHTTGHDVEAAGLRTGAIKDANADIFNCRQAAHWNHLEHLPGFLALLIMGMFSFPLPAAIIGLIWLLGRQLYAHGYYRGPERRVIWGFLHYLALWALVGLVLAFMVYLFQRRAPYVLRLAGQDHLPWEGWWHGYGGVGYGWTNQGPGPRGASTL